MAGLLTSGAYETTGLLVLVMSAGALVAVWPNRARLLSVASLGGGALVGLLLLTVMPGTSSRKTDLVNGLPAGTAVELALNHTVDYVESLLRTDEVWLALAAGLIAVAPKVPVARAVRWVAAGAVATFLALSAGFTLSMWSLGSAPPGRTLTVSVAAFAAFLFLVGWLVSMPRAATAVVAILSAVFVVHSSLPSYDRIDSRRAWAEAWDRRHATLRAARPGSTVEVPLLPAPGGLEDLAGDPESWVNGAAAEYYGVEAIIAVPTPEG